MLIHSDLSENDSMKYSTEIQAFHFGSSRKQYTLHTSQISADFLGFRFVCYVEKHNNDKTIIVNRLIKLDYSYRICCIRK